MAENEAVAWQDSLPAELKDNATLRNYKSVGDLAKALVETKSMVGKAIFLPEKDDPKEWHDKVYSKLGVPDSPDKYSRLDPKLAPEGVTVSEDFQGKFYSWAHTNNLTNKQANDLLQRVNTFNYENLKAGDEESKMELQKSEEALNKFFGKARPAREEAIERFLAQHAPPGFLDQAKEQGLTKDPQFMTFMDTVSKQYVEDHAITKSSNRAVDPRFSTPDVIRSRKEELMKSPEYLNGNHPRHQARVQEVYELNRMLVPQT